MTAPSREPYDIPPSIDLEALKAEAEASDPPSANRWANSRPDEQAQLLGMAAQTRAKLDADRREHEKPLTDEQAQMVARIRAVTGERLADCVATFREWLHLPDPGALMVVLATVAANRGVGDPTWLLLVGPPGGGKTEMLNPLARLPDLYPAATLTEAALLSGTSTRERTADSSGGLLRRIGAFGIIVCKDFGSVLSMHRDARAAVLAALREIHDGAWTRHVGTDGGRTLSWSGKVGLIAGCTPAIDSHHAVMGSMGERFVLYRLPRTDADAQARRALAHVGHEAEMRAALGDAVGTVLDRADSALLTAPADASTSDRLVALATLAVRCRSAVERDGYSREIELIPESEAPARLALVLLRLLNALGAVGVDDPTAWRLVARCALDSMPAIRRLVLEDLVGRPDGATTTEIATRVDYPTTTTRRALEDLTAHGILRRESGGQGRSDHWDVTEWARARLWTIPEMSFDAHHRRNGGEIVFSSPSTDAHDDVSGTVPDAPQSSFNDPRDPLPTDIWRRPDGAGS